MMYTRAAASDYDDWESVYDNPGWGSKDLIPLLKKVCRPRSLFTRARILITVTRLLLGRNLSTCRTR